MCDLQGAINFSYFLYNMMPTKVVLKDQIQIFDNFYVEDETISMPMWYSKLLRQMKHASIKEYDSFDKMFNQLIADQNLNKESLIKLPRDFYFLAYDVIKSLKNGKYKERIHKLANFKELRQRIILQSIELGLESRVIDNMTFEEGLYYTEIIKSRNKLFAQVNSLEIEESEEE